MLDRTPGRADTFYMNKQNRMKIGLVVGVVAGGFMLFQNMTLSEFSELNMPDVDEEARQEQARELLGRYYSGSLASKLEGEQDINYLIYSKFNRALGEPYRKRAAEITQVLINESNEQQIDPVFILAVIQTESTFNTRARGTAGEIGLMQVLPRTGEWIARKYKLPWNGENTLYDPVANIRIGIAYFGFLREQFDSRAYHYLPAYNMGPKNLRRIERTIGSITPEGKVMPREYAVKVMKNYQLVYEQMVAMQKDLSQQRDEVAQQRGDFLNIPLFDTGQPQRAPANQNRKELLPKVAQDKDQNSRM